MTKKKNPENLKRYPEGYIITRPNGTQWIKKNGIFEYIKKGYPKRTKYPSCKLPEYIPPVPENIKLHQTKFDGYFVCEDGSIWCEWHRNPVRRGYARKMSQNFRGGSDKNDRYLSVNISIKDSINPDKTKSQINYYSHRLIAETLIPNPSNYDSVDHKDRNKQNNNVNNLQWMPIGQNKSIWKRGKKLKEKISEANKGEKNPFYGKTHSEESRKKMKEAHKKNFPQV